MPEQPPESTRRERTPFAKLESLVRRHEELSNSLADPSVLADPKQYNEYARAFAELEPVVEHVQALRATASQIGGGMEHERLLIRAHQSERVPEAEI